MKKLKSLVTSAFLAFLFASSCIINTSAAQEINLYLGYQLVPVVVGENSIGNNYLPSYGSDLEYVIPYVPIGSTFNIYTNNNWLINTYDQFSVPPIWVPEHTISFKHGDAGYLLSTAVTNIVLFGKMPIGQTTTIFSNYAANPFQNYFLIASKFPKDGFLTTDLGFTPNNGDLILTVENQNGTNKYSLFSYNTLFGGWLPNEPFIKKHTGFWYRKLSTTDATWIQNSPYTNPDGRDYGIFHVGKNFVGSELLYVWSLQKAGENIEFQHSSDNGATFSNFLSVGAGNVDQTTSATYHVQTWQNDYGLIRVHITKP